MEGEEDDEKDLRRSANAIIGAMRHINKEIIDSDRMNDKDLAFPAPPGEKRI